MKVAAKEFFKRASEIMAKREEDAKIKMNRLNEIEPVKDEVWSGKAKEDIELTALFKEMIQSLSLIIEGDAPFGFFSMGRKLIVIEHFLKQYISSFPDQSSMYEDKAKDRIYSKLSEIFEVLDIPKEVLVKIWMDGT